MFICLAMYLHCFLLLVQLFGCILQYLKKISVELRLIRLGIYALVFCVFYGYGQFLQIKQIEVRENVVKLIQQYEHDHGKYPEHEFIDGINAKYFKYQIRFIYYLYPVTISEDESSIKHMYHLSYRTMLLAPFDDVIYRGENEWEIIYD